jgi:hypothetical protein
MARFGLKIRLPTQPQPFFAACRWGLVEPRSAKISLNIPFCRAVRKKPAVLSTNTATDLIQISVVWPERPCSIVETAAEGLSGNRRRQQRGEKMLYGIGIVVFWTAVIISAFLLFEKLSPERKTGLIVALISLVNRPQRFLNALPAPETQYDHAHLGDALAVSHCSLHRGF